MLRRRAPAEPSAAANIQIKQGGPRLMSFLYRYLLIVLACGSLLLGIQIPNFVDQYQKRLDAHLQEVVNNLKGFQEVADREFGGSLEALIRKHKESDDATFRAEAEPIETMYLRQVHFRSQHDALQVSLPQQAWFLALHGDPQLLQETWSSYSFAVPLNSLALLSGFGLVAGLLLLVEVVAALFGAIFGLRIPSRRIRSVRY
jgi:hypothetical protein